MKITPTEEMYENTQTIYCNCCGHPIGDTANDGQSILECYVCGNETDYEPHYYE